MCGIAVSWGAVGDDTVRTMLDRIRHRGPDGEGVAIRGKACLGHVRLSILDLEGGAQPMANERGDLAVAFNGEVYNHLELRRTIEPRHAFSSRSDTEVLLHLYEEEGEDMLPRLDGMFAMAIAGPGGLLLARDALGIKPLYYGRREGVLLASSELKAFPPMDELHMLPAGHAMLHDGEPWRVSLPYPPRPRISEVPLEAVLKDIRRLLERAVEKRLMADVPVGVFLSGGLDSSLVAALMRPHVVELHSFTAGMEGAPDLEAARRVAAHLGTVHHELRYSEKDVEEALPEVIRHLESFDAPLVRSAIPMYFIAKLAARHVKVALMGEGADELFAGYEYLSRLGGGECLRRELTDITLRLQDTNLQRGDRMTMAHGLEGRVPFLDGDLVRYVARLPVDLLEPRPDRPEKWLLREACRGILPDSILQRKKMKFSEGAGSSEVIARLADSSISEDEFRRTKAVEPGVVLRSPEELYSYRIWREAFGSHISASLVGRTLDRAAAGTP
ncbi:MAG: asparagine synthase-related protein [Acidobacteriota bacterium]